MTDDQIQRAKYSDQRQGGRINLMDVIIAALEQGREVRIEDADRYGYHITVDGQPINRLDENAVVGGFAWETFDYELTEPSSRIGIESLEKCLELVASDRCGWTCPECGQLCGGIDDHDGAHECVNDVCRKVGVKRTDLQQGGNADD